MDWIIRDARPADEAAIVAFNEQLAAETEGKTLSRAVLAAGVRRLLGDRALGRYFVAERDGQLIGQCMITYEWSDWRNGMIWWLQSVYVDAEHRRQGVFPSLYRHIVQLAREGGEVRAIRLYVDERNGAAQAVYAALGLEPAGYFVLEKEFPPRH